MALAIMTSIIQKTARSLAEKLKLWILNALLWGGVILLALEHVWHHEVVPWPPFLTAMANPADIPVMLHEMATVGTAMSIVHVPHMGNNTHNKPLHAKNRILESHRTRKETVHYTLKTPLPPLFFGGLK
jgi:hypothetical protein